MGGIVYWSSKTENTHKFVLKLGLPSLRIPISPLVGEMPVADRPYVLVVPTYGETEETGAVPKPVETFLANPFNASLLRGVIAGGNMNFGPTYGMAGEVIARRHGTKYLYRFELAGMPSDVENVRKGLERLWTQ